MATTPETKTITLLVRTDAEGRACVELPPLEPDHLYEATVALSSQGFMHPSWPRGYEKVFGALTDETFVIPPDPPEPIIDIEFP